MFDKCLNIFFKAEEGLIARNQYDELGVYSIYAPFEYCEMTGERLIKIPNENKDFIRNSSGNPISPTIEDDYFVCEYCGEFHENEAKFTEEVYGYTEICDACVDENFFKCEDCEKWYSLNEHANYITYDDRTICEDCYMENYSTCECCNEIHRTEDMYTTHDNYNLCEGCWNNEARTCADCGEVFYSRISYNEEEDCDICYDCEEARSNVIHNYSFKPSPRFLKEDGEETEEFFGFEIEVAGNTKYAKDFLEYFDEQLYLKYDSSVAGFEIVTHPMTRRYFYETFSDKLKDGMDFLNSKGFRGHNEGGIHMHISNKAISAKQLKGMTFLLYPKRQKDHDIIRAMVQRRERALSSYARMDLNEDMKGYFRRVDDYNGCESKPCKSTRYTAVNTENLHTTEIRLYNSSTRIERIIKNAEMTFSILDFCAVANVPSVKNYLNFIRKNKEDYPTLFAFLIEKEIIRSEEKQKELEEVMNKLGVKNTTGLESLLSRLGIEPNTNVDDTDERNTECA